MVTCNNKIHVLIRKIPLFSLHDSHVNSLKSMVVSSQPGICRKRQGEDFDKERRLKGGELEIYIGIISFSKRKDADLFPAEI